MQLCYISCIPVQQCTALAPAPVLCPAVGTNASVSLYRFDAHVRHAWCCLAAAMAKPSADREQQFVTSAFAVYATEVRKAIGNQQQQLDQLRGAHEQLHQTLDSLEQLPNKLQHQVMVPMGKHAFFPGHLTRTNEIMVHLGDQYYVEVTAGHARGILQRKQAAVADGISKAQQQLKALQARLDVSSDSVGSATEHPEAREIRSSLAESDALLASAASRRKAAAAAAREQCTQEHAQRIRSSSGYSYTRPQGPITVQRSAQEDAEDVELQARLEQLLLLEQQQEQREGLLDSVDLQHQHQQHAGLDTIQEGDEDSAQSGLPVAAGAFGTVEQQQGAAGSGSEQLSAVHHLQQLEAQSDSDDDELHPQALLQELQQQALQAQQQQQQVQEQAALPQQRQQAQQQQQQQRPLKSALKKGFLGPASSSDSRSNTRSAASSSAAPAPKPKPAVFTGAVVERAASDAAAGLAAPVVADIGERPAQVVGGAAASGSSSSSSSSAVGSSSKPMSKFKMRRLGLEPEAV
jgi:prefoldin alpha subunit